ncbi:hypothetical protein AcW2_006074 [Taiwanofungus camphoratus]|nr:hypothetical protein AcW2_006074 [Antrodia cinnamomea]
MMTMLSHAPILIHDSTRLIGAQCSPLSMNNDDEVYILLLLSDSNLPTGSFVASAGLESYATHGFFASSSLSLSRDKLDATTEFVRDSLATYARSALPFVSDAYGIVEKLVTGYSDGDEEEELEGATSDINALDDLYEAMTLNHVARRASKSQGVALLTLFSKGFTKPSFLHSRSSEPSAESEMHTRREARTLKFVERYKLRVRHDFDETINGPAVTWPLGEILATRHDLQHSRIFNS